MNIQIFGKSKSFDTKKAERWFKERRIKYQYIDLVSKGVSPGEYRSIRAAVGSFDALVDKDCRAYEALYMAYITPQAAEEKLLEYPELFAAPIVRNGKQATVGYQPMHVNFGLVPPLEDGKRRSKRDRYQAYADRALEALDAYLATRSDLFGGDRS